jgi:multidrug resistance efflux pump
MRNDADCPAKNVLRMSRPGRATVRALEAQVAHLEAQVRQLDAQVAALLADVTTLEAACTAMRRRLAGRPLTSHA